MKKERTGNILRIERSSLHDGRGLRTVVFMKGCFLQCQWCSTPESQSFEKEFGFRKDFCTGCGICVAACPHGALSMKEGHPVRDRNRCDGCGNCARSCPRSAWLLYGKTMTVSELVREIEKDSLFFFYSGGGVTFSGGEPLAQADFLAQVTAECCEKGLECGIETCLWVPWENVEKVLPNLAWMFIDLKQMEPEKHQFLTGRTNERILENLRRIDQGPLHIPVHIRIPLIPGVNDDEKNLRATAAFCESLSCVEDIELLPYHRLGIETYRHLGRDYSLAEVETPGASRMQRAAEILRSEMKRVWVITDQPE